MTEITQEDRDAAARAATIPEYRDLCRAGRVDGGILVQAFATHRRQAEAKVEGLLREARERLRAIQSACGDYLPPDSWITEHDLANTVIGLTDDRPYIDMVTRIDAHLSHNPHADEGAE